MIVPLPGLIASRSIDGLCAVFDKHILIDWGSIRLRHGPKWNEIISNFRSSPLSHFLHGFLTNDTSTTRVWHASFVPGSHMMTEWGSNIVPRSIELMKECSNFSIWALVDGHFVWSAHYADYAHDIKTLVSKDSKVWFQCYNCRYLLAPKKSGCRAFMTCQCGMSTLSKW